MMGTKQSIQFSIGKIPKGLGLGALISLSVTLAGSAVCAWLLTLEKIGEKDIGYVAVMVLLLSSILGAFVAVGLIKEKRVPICLIAGGCYWLTLLAITALFFGGEYSGVGESALVILAGIVSVALLGLKGDKRTKKRRK